MHTEEQLNDEIVKGLKSKIGRLYRDLKKLAMYKRMDPFSLRQRVITLECGYHDMHSDEMQQLGIADTKELNSRIQEHALMKFMKFSMTINLTTSQTVNHMLQLSKEQWNLFMGTKDKWMGNFYQDDDVAEALKWEKFNKLKSVILKQALGRIQASRSFNENIIVKKDIWDTKNYFRNKVIEFILKNNMREDVTNMLDLERAVIRDIK